MQIRCPHCHVPFESRDDPSWTDIICPSCDNSFSLLGAASTRSYRTGAKVLGRFELVDEVGSGRFGSVWKARDTQLQRTVAVKIPRQRDLTEQETELFLRDARAAAQLNHAGIASVHEIGREDDTLYIVTDFIDGANLNEWLSGKRLTPLESAALVCKIAEALHHAHNAGVIHRDVKPGNIMLDRDGEPYVIDFGLARREVGEVTMTADGQVLGTPAYMSPEQARGEGHQADRRSDIYSLGVVLFKLLTGELPFRGELRMLLLQIINDEPPSPRALNANVPRDLETITLKCLEKDATKRYQTAHELAEDLTHFLTGEPIKARPIGRVERGWRWCKRHPEVASLSGALLLVLLGVSIVAPVMAVHEAQLRKESDRRGKELQNQVAQNLFQRACEELDTGRTAGGIALLAAAYAQIDSDNPLSGAIRSLLPGWAIQSGQPLLHDAPVLAVAISPDNRLALTAGHDRTARLWDVQTGLPVGQPLKHTDSVRAAAFSPDGNFVLTGCQDSIARLWDVRALVEPKMQFPNLDKIWSVAFSADGKTIATGGRDHSVMLWDSHSGATLAKAFPHPDKLLALAFNPNASTLLTGCYDGTARLWNIQTKKEQERSIQIGKPIYAVAFDPSGSKILTASANMEAAQWDARTLKPIGQPMKHERLVYAAAWSPDGRTVLTGSFDTTARLWNAATCRPIGNPLRHSDWIMAVAFSPDGRTLITGGADRTARIWRVRPGRTIKQAGSASRAVFSPDGRWMVAPSGEKSMQRFDARTGKPFGPTLQYDAPILCITVGLGGKTIVAGCGDQTIRLWNAESGELIPETIKLDAIPTSIIAGAGGTALLVQDASNAVQLWDMRSCRPVSSLLHFDKSQHLLASSPDGQSILVSKTDDTGQIWDLRTGKAQKALVHHEAKISAAAFSTDGSKLVTGGQDQKVCAWDAHTGNELISPIRHGGFVNTVAFGPRGERLLSGGGEQTARLWDAQTGAPQGQPMQHPSEVLKIAPSPDSRLVVTICDDGSARLWELESCKLVDRPLQYEIGIDGAELKIKDGVFNADGSVIAFQCDDGATRLYDVPQQLVDDRQFVASWARVRSGFRLDEQGILRQLSQSEWLEAQKQLELLQKSRQAHDASGQR